MSFTMHSPSQGYANTSADVYAGRGYGSHLMVSATGQPSSNINQGVHLQAQNYCSYLNRDESYSNTSTAISGHHYPNGQGLQSAHYPNSNSITQHTYPSLSPISHFPPQQDLYSSCMPPSRNHSYSNTPNAVSANLTSVPRHVLNSKPYWNCESSISQPPNCYTSSSGASASAVGGSGGGGSNGGAGSGGGGGGGGSSSSSTHKSSPQAWSHSPNVLSSPSSTPSPIPGGSTPHHFTSSPHHHSQSHSESHKSYNGLLNNNTNLSNNTSVSNNCNSNPLQSLQKMVQIETDTNELRVQYENNPSAGVPMSSVTQHTTVSTNPQMSSIESDSAYPTYYNLDQNRMCATPQSTYVPMSAQSINSTNFSSTLTKNTSEIRPQPLSTNCTKQENGNDNGSEQTTISRTTNNLRFSSKLSKEPSGSFFNSQSCSTDTCSNGSPSAHSTKLSITEPTLLTEQTHDSVNSLRSSDNTANSRDSVKSTDSDGASSFAINQCSTPNNNWKMSSVGNQSNDFRATNFATTSSGKTAWWPENVPSSNNRSFTPHIGDCAQFSPTVNYTSNQVTHALQSSSIGQSQTWNQPPSSTSSSSAKIAPQILSTAFQSDAVVIKKKRGRPFGSKNRRNLENAPVPTQPVEVTKRRRKVALVDVGVNTSLSFDVRASLHYDDAYAFGLDSTVKHSQPLVMRRSKVIGPVVRIDKTNATASPQIKYSIVNAAKTVETNDINEPKVKTQSLKAQLQNNVSQSRKNGFSKKTLNTVSGNSHSNLQEKNWLCVLCHKGPHHKGLGDLFGPYCISLDKSKLTNIHELEQEPYEDLTETSEQRSEQPCERRSLRRRTELSNEENNKNKQAATNNANVLDDNKECKVNIEVWIHEDCIVWSNNVYLDGSKIRNLEPAIVESFNNICTKCKLPGATLGCFYKNCNVSPLHYLCAKDKDCDLDEEKFILSCSKHKKRRMASTEVEVDISIPTNPVPSES